MIDKSTVYNLQDSIQIKTGEVISESLVNDDNIDITTFGFYQNEGISFEESDFDRFYIAIENVLDMEIEQEDAENIKYALTPYDFTLISKDISREISGKDDYKLLMITIKRKETMLKNIEKEKLLKLDEEIEYKENKVVSKTLANDEKLKMTLFAFKGVQELSTHKAPGDAFVIVLDGEARINIDGKDFMVKKGESIIMPAKIPHGVYVTDKFKMLLIVSK